MSGDSRVLLVDIAMNDGLIYEPITAYRIDLHLVHSKAIVVLPDMRLDPHLLAYDLIDDAVLAVALLPKSNRAIAALSKWSDWAPICSKIMSVI